MNRFGHSFDTTRHHRKHRPDDVPPSIKSIASIDVIATMLLDDSKDGSGRLSSIWRLKDVRYQSLLLGEQRLLLLRMSNDKILADTRYTSCRLHHIGGVPLRSATALWTKSNDASSM